MARTFSGGLRVFLQQTSTPFANTTANAKADPSHLIRRQLPEGPTTGWAAQRAPPTTQGERHRAGGSLGRGWAVRLGFAAFRNPFVPVPGPCAPEAVPRPRRGPGAVPAGGR